ncbi:hypothetical protein F7Q99_27885 [Streptomyces kaniharaensis]|uniref:DAPG hydrolase PhiG domain-containing protein n=1 Tax=Streptomyces kaniharaensis TaxID=212423 RepID=A0A6N7KWS9_9ACTN|nr:hypothetical protein [Streptomyces kaniharaensis]MQS15970.1 hypothetical protein [Streptomyces kaniharaensis]
MTSYQPTPADAAPIPDQYATKPRYLGYQAPEAAKPHAKYFRAQTLPVQDHVREALLSMAPTEYAYDIRDAARRMSSPGYHAMETGWTRTDGGLMVSCLTDMPGVTAEMWDWWFGWHSTDSSRYKLWNPEAHQFAAIGEDRSADRTLTDRQRYVDNVSYVDEYIGGRLDRLAIRFTDPTRLGFDRMAPGHTAICARVGPSQYPIALGWLIHQIRPTTNGCEMRSRFFLSHPQLLNLPAHSSTARAAALLTTKPARALAGAALPHLAGKALRPGYGHDLLHDCAAEMNHLASFLPALHEEFNGTP